MQDGKGENELPQAGEISGYLACCSSKSGSYLRLFLLLVYSGQGTPEAPVP